MGGSNHASSIWGVFKSQATVKQQGQIDDLVDYAKQLLERVVETLPTYTLHNQQHAENILARMEDLLGENAQNLTALEAAILILAAYYHDIGMVFTEDERSHLQDSPDFEDFLAAHPRMALALEGESGALLPTDVAESYCRWAHAERVFVHLNRLENPLNEALRWETVDLTLALGEICRSHNLRADALMDDAAFPTDYLGDADLRFCAIMLRLADILDFDRSRSPAAVYEYLGLAKSTEERKQRSQSEWKKHLSVHGFKFSPEPERYPGYPIRFIAGPDEPAVEHDVRQFLDTIENELRDCANVLHYCSPRWREFHLPGSIIRKDIRSNGYKYGPYRFELNRSEILQLFTGEDLYENKYAFVRELLQNSIDASRHRKYAEEARSRRVYEPEPITVSSWRDHYGYQWIEISDGGIGMDEEILLNYFLQVGRSYYVSPEFEAELLSYNLSGSQTFRPISRFGIGLVSCFIVADQVEVSTRHARGKADPIRLSMRGRDGFYSLQTGNLRATPMPGEAGDQPGYRTRPGTTIAVRLDPARESGDLALGDLLRSLIAVPAVEVRYEGEVINGGLRRLFDTPPMAEMEAEIPTDAREELARQLDKLGFPPSALEENIRLRFVPLDLDAASPQDELRGRLLAIHLLGVRWSDLRVLEDQDTDKEDPDDSGVPNVSITPAVYSREKGPEIGFILVRQRADSGGTIDRISISQISLDQIIKDTKFATAAEHLLTAAPSSHNGIVLPHRGLVGFDLVGPPTIHLTGEHGDLGGVLCMGHMSFRDRLRPELDVSRDRVRAVSWEMQSVTNLAFRRALTVAGFKPPLGSAIRRLWLEGDGHFERPPLLGILLDDPLLKDANAWPAEPIVPTSKGMMRMVDIESESDPNQVVLTFLPSFGQSGYRVRIRSRDVRHDEFYATCVAAMLATRIHLTLVPREKTWEIAILDTRPAGVLDGEKLFPPLTFLPYQESPLLYVSGLPLNRDHPFSQWLLARAAIMTEIHPGLFNSIRSKILDLQNHNAKQSNIIGSLNQMLSRIGELAPDLRAPQSSYPKEEDCL
jgi:hypothetical protein